MNLQEFHQKNLGQFVEVAGSASAKNQCVDLANAYIRDVWGLPMIEWTNAVDFPSRAGDKYEFIANTPNGVPQAGDLVIFKKYGSLYGEPGHIGICMYSDLHNIKLFEQNYPTGTACRVGDHNYYGCVGWLRAKPQVSGYASLFEKYGYPANIPLGTLEVVFQKYTEWRDKLLSKQLLTKEEYDKDFKDAQTALQRNESYRQNLAKNLFNDNSVGWDKILESVPLIIREADSEQKPAKAAHELFGKVNELYHNVYVYPEDISTALEAFYRLFLENKSKLDALEAQKVEENKDVVINDPPAVTKSIIDTIIEFWRSRWPKKNTT